MGHCYRNIPGTDKQGWIYQLKGWCECAQIGFVPDQTTFVVSVHSPAYNFERKRLKNVDISGIKLKLNPDLWLLDVIFYFLKNYLDRRILVGGDFNYSRLLDPPDCLTSAKFGQGWIFPKLWFPITKPS
jgi:hypothetical protein